MILSLAFLSACSDSSSDDVDTGFIELDFDTSYSWDATKAYDALAGQTCSGNDCICIYIDEEIDGVSYTGFAARSDDNSFNIKIYSSDWGTSYTVNLKVASTTASCSSNAGAIFSYGPSEDTSGFMTATFINNEICSSGYYYGSNNIVAPIY
jgi:hypothetical protein